MQWFEVDRKGLAQLMARRGKGQVLLELISNALDTNTKQVRVWIKPVAGVPKVSVSVEDDDPEGFKRLADAWTLFGESNRRGDAEKRGRFCLGEKLVLALCEEASIATTTGMVAFDAEGRHNHPRVKRERGSAFNGILRMTREEVEEANKAVASILVPAGITLTINGETLPPRVPERVVEQVLPTEVPDADGVMRPTKRKTKLGIHKPKLGEKAMLYELGIPVVELPDSDPFSLDVGQKVPLNMDRDNVTPGYLRELRVLVMNAMHASLTPEQASAPWARAAAGDERVAPEAVVAVTKLKFGEKAVIADPSDPEGTKLAMSQGYTVVMGGAMSKDEWAQVRKVNVLLPAGKVTPSPKPYIDGADSKNVQVVTPRGSQAVVVAYLERLIPVLLRETGEDVSQVTVRLVHTPNQFVACYGKGAPLDLNLRCLSAAWFDRAAQGKLDELLELMVHELGHHFSLDHFAEAYHDGLCKLAAGLARLTFKNPGLVFGPPTLTV